MNALLHGHHVGLISWNREYEQRRQEILAFKPECEHAIRLRCVQLITREMLEDLPRVVAESYCAYEGAYRTCEDTYRTYEGNRSAYGEACRAYYAAGRARDEAVLSHSADLEAWHQRWCSALKTTEGCPWNGERLVGVGE